MSADPTKQNDCPFDEEDATAVAMPYLKPCKRARLLGVYLT